MNRSYKCRALPRRQRAGKNQKRDTGKINGFGVIIKSLYQALACGALAALRLVTELCCVGGGISFHLLLAGVFRAWSTSKLRQMWGFNKTSNSIVLNQQNPRDFWGKISPLSRYSIKHQHRVTGNLISAISAAQQPRGMGGDGRHHLIHPEHSNSCL